MNGRLEDNAKRTIELPDICRPIAEAAPTPIAAVEGAGYTVRYANHAFCLLVGKSKEELIGTAFCDVVPAGDEYRSLLDRVYRTGQAQTHIGHARSKRHPFYWSCSVWPLLAAEDRPVGILIQVTEATPSQERATALNQALMISSVRQHELTEEAERLNEKLQLEIAERKRVEEELKSRNVELAQSRDFANSIVQNVSQPLVVLDTEMRIKNANQAFYQCFQTSPASTEFLHRIEGGQWDIPELRALLKEVLPANKSFTDFEVDREFANAGHKIVLISARQLEQAQMVLLSIQDITERRKAEEVLRATEGRLRHVQKMEAIGRLAGGVAHEFNNLLTGILGHSALLLDSIGPDENRHRESIEVILQCAQRGAELTKQLLAFSRRQVPQMQVFTLKSALADMERMLRRVLGEHIELVVNPGAARGFIRADPAQIGQVIMNLALNARDAMLYGGTLTIQTEAVDVKATSPLEHLKPGRYVMLAVKDTGIGMDKVTQSHLFEPFFTTKGQGLGTGLGLATIFAIVEESGAQIRFSSELGHGTTFRIYFPHVAEPRRILEAETGSMRPEPLSKAPAGSEIVLIAEDEETIRRLARSFLESKGYKVLEAQDGRQALEICKNHEHIDLLLTDIRMPRMGGRQLAEQATPLHPEMKLLFMSGYTDDSLIAEGVKTKGVPFIQKPFTLPALAHKVREVLGSKGEHKRLKANV